MQQSSGMLHNYAPVGRSSQLPSHVTPSLVPRVPHTQQMHVEGREGATRGHSRVRRRLSPMALESHYCLILPYLRNSED